VMIVAMLIFFLIRGQSLRIMKGEGGKIFTAGLCAGVTAVGYLSSLSFIPAGIAVAIFYMFPLFLILLTGFKNGGTLPNQKIIAFLIAFIGILLCVGPSVEHLDWRGLALVFVAAISCALLFSITASIKQDRLSLIFWIQLIALPLLIPAAWSSGFSSAVDITNVWLAVVISAVGFYIGFACQVYCGDKVPPATLGLIFLIEPVVTILTAAFFLGEKMLPIQYLGITLVLAGLAYDMGRDIWRQRESNPI
jgi:drug/metabolite transporter (DMT)-like permease